MDQHIAEYYRESGGNNLSPGSFNRVIQLNKHPDMNWEEVQKLCPHMSRGWFEFGHLNVADRIEFSKEYWISKLPYHESVSRVVGKVFRLSR